MKARIPGLRRVSVSLALCVALGGCAVAPPAQSPPPPPALQSPFTGYASARYRESRWWLCMPGRQDACAGDLDATELGPDGTRIEVRDTRAPGADDVDCFYVYPTVDFRPWAATHENFADLTAVTAATVQQAARFRSACRLYVPLYRQASIGTYLRDEDRRAPYREVAASDVVDAFLHYMGQYNAGRKIVLIGHSQGAEMIVRLLQRFFDGDAVMRNRLLLAMPIGWPLEVAPGKATGGTFAQLPVCTEAGQTGCVVAYRSYASVRPAEPGRAMPSPGRESVCVHPGLLAHGTTSLSRSFLAVPRLLGLPEWVLPVHGAEGVRTPFVLVRDLYEARCVSGQAGFRYLAVSEAPRAPGDVRVGPVDLSNALFRSELGTHLLDIQLAEGDLVDLVAQRAARLATAESDGTPR